jgi:hypothetical protein
LSRARINPGFWADRLAVNAQQAVFHQWEQLEASGCIENFRIAAGESQAFRTGWFFADSDAFKWLDAASQIWRDSPDPHLASLMDEFIRLIARAQDPDGYLFTYNQIHFPGTRWQNLQIEHELYCHGHLIEAGVSYFEATGRTDLLDLARKAADRIVADFRGTNPDFTPGHEEIEIALLRLHEVTPGDTIYLELARQFLENRGKIKGFGWKVLLQQLYSGRRGREVARAREEYLAAHPDAVQHKLPSGNPARKPPFVKLRWAVNALNGKYFQQHNSLRQQTRAEGHSVRFTYLQTAAAMLARETRDKSLIPPLERAWNSMVLRRMYVTGGIGSLPELEGFGKDYELDDEYAYAETCAALGSLFWNWEMTLLTGDARHSDLFEWQLYNAAGVGMGRNGKGYFYNNPLACRGQVTRLPWYAVPCCPSNLSRTFADLGRFIYSADENVLTVHQYISSDWTDEAGKTAEETPHLTIHQEAQLPWQGKVRLVVSPLPGRHEQIELRLRQPSWTGGMRVKVNGADYAGYPPLPVEEGEPPASGVDPRCSTYRSVRRTWSAGDVVDIEFDMPVLLRRAHPRVKRHAQKAAVTRGPLVYCLESTDNAGVDLFTARLDPDSLQVVEDEGTIKMQGRTINGEVLVFTPYYAWGNRGPSQMTVWINI